MKIYWALFSEMLGVKYLRSYYTGFLNSEKAESRLERLKGVDASYL